MLPPFVETRRCDIALAQAVPVENFRRRGPVIRIFSSLKYSMNVVIPPSLNSLNYLGAAFSGVFRGGVVPPYPLGLTVIFLINFVLFCKLRFAIEVPCPMQGF